MKHNTKLECVVDCLMPFVYSLKAEQKTGD